MSTNLHEYGPQGHHSLCRVCGFGRNHPWHDLDDEALAAARPNCVACGDWDDTVAEVAVTRRSTALLCATCAASEGVLTALAAEDGLDEVDE